MSSTMEDSFSAWNHASGNSFGLASRLVVLAATNVAAFAVTLYVFVQHSHRKYQYAMIGALSTAHVLTIIQTSLLVVSCSYGWGSDINALPAAFAQRGDKYFFASNVIIIVIHGLSRASVCASLSHANTQTKFAKYTMVLSGALVLWTIGSLLAIALIRLKGVEYWSPIGRDLNPALWTGIVLAGIAIDLVIAGLSISLVAGLQMSKTNKLYTSCVFGIGLLANVPFLYAITYLHQHHEQIVLNPTLLSSPYIYANQIAITVSLWCRALEAARRLQRDVGHATWGHAGTTINGSYGRSGPTQYPYATGSFRQQYLSSKGRRPRAEDEVELKSVNRPVTYQTSIRADGDGDRSTDGDGIDVTKQVWVD